MTCNTSSRNQVSSVNESVAIFIIRAVLSFLENIFPTTFSKRIIAAILLAAGIPVKRIQTLLNMGRSTIYDLRKAIENAQGPEDITCLFQMKQGCGRKSKAISVLNEILREIEQGFYTSLREIQHMIQDQYGIMLSVASTHRLMDKLGIKRLKSASFPAKADPVLQKNFYDSILHPLMQKAKENKLALLFMDGSHFVIGCDFLGFVYGVVRRFVHSHSGRQRYNVLGALDFITKQVHTVTNTTYLTATQIIEMLHKIVDYYGHEKPIRIVLDNARYQKCEAVRQMMSELKKTYDIELVYLPSYSPNLNLVERIWRFVKAEIRSSFTRDFTSFCASIDAAIDSTTKSAKSRIDSLIGEKIQLYSSLIPVDAHTFVMPMNKYT